MPSDTPTTEAGRRLLGWLRVVAAGELPPPLDTAGPAIAAIEAEAVRSFAERVARMGSCSQTHHEHLAMDARRLLQAETPDASDSGEEGAEDIGTVRERCQCDHTRAEHEGPRRVCRHRCAPPWVVRSAASREPRP
jgi:hypothetical protein